MNDSRNSVAATVLAEIKSPSATTASLHTGRKIGLLAVLPKEEEIIVAYPHQEEEEEEEEEEMIVVHPHQEEEMIVVHPHQEEEMSVAARSMPQERVGATRLPWREAAIVDAKTQRRISRFVRTCDVITQRVGRSVPTADAVKNTMRNRFIHIGDKKMPLHLHDAILMPHS